MSLIDKYIFFKILSCNWSASDAGLASLVNQFLASVKLCQIKHAELTHVVTPLPKQPLVCI